ncbi:tRNA modification GTPase GTPBP3, mitochondrial [Porphyridium purpureum]|uniref:tRNA modification GTPase GTPBP3, mitochondrial n=1 Tax=Porphyridium purpureum TaxID=35688 RepID=A0A5J4YTG5_PORPP|nr:tRNA modification GTPase GTPBP3, mitochondrial [Porphyridium purpureum]|eukprot:POR6415..scf229_5
MSDSHRRTLPEQDTIFALSSGASQKAGVAVIRISGPHADVVLRHLLSAQDVSDPDPELALPKARMASLRKLFGGISSTSVDAGAALVGNMKEILDQALVLRFPGPRSFTGEDVVELHVHGGLAVVSAVTNELMRLRMHPLAIPLRPAEKGEFTRRAFENDRMDLTEVEGLADLISAETTEQRRLALRQMGGNLRVLYDSWRAQIIKCMANVEAVIDFGDDVDDDALDAMAPLLRDLEAELSAHVQDNRRGEIVRSGVRVAIVGAPNAGKSSLLNALAKRPAAIVSSVAGTTRDVIEVHLDVAGVAVILSDTAGIREETEDAIEQIGIERAKQALADADLVLHVVDVRQTDGASMRAFSDTQSDSVGVVTVFNKTDLSSEEERQVAAATMQQLGRAKGSELWISCTTGAGMDAFQSAFETRVRELLWNNSSGTGHECDASPTAVITRARHRVHVENAIHSLRTFIHEFLEQNNLPLDIATEELRHAASELGQITGTIHTEDVLDIVFQDFCIGK